MRRVVLLVVSCMIAVSSVVDAEEATCSEVQAAMAAEMSAGPSVEGAADPSAPDGDPNCLLVTTHCSSDPQCHVMTSSTIHPFQKANEWQLGGVGGSACGWKFCGSLACPCGWQVVTSICE